MCTSLDSWNDNNQPAMPTFQYVIIDATQFGVQNTSQKVQKMQDTLNQYGSQGYRVAFVDGPLYTLEKRTKNA